MAEADNDDARTAPALREPDEDLDPVAEIQPLRVVSQMQTRLVAVQVEPPKPVQKPEGRMNIILKPFVAAARGVGMATMSDLGKAGTSGVTPKVARPTRRPVPPAAKSESTE